MPHVHVKKDYFFDLLGKKYTLQELDEICFQFGIEVEDDKEDDSKLIFEISANRHDLLSAEGLADALGLFQGVKTSLPTYKLIKPQNPLKMFVKKETQQIRPYVVCAVLRNIKFDQERYESFIDLQDKLHQNICRKRTLVAIGTHDLDTIQGPFSYEARSPKDLSFIPLNQTQKMDGEQLMEFYSNDNKLKHYLYIIKESPVYPIIYDANGHVLSLPPIINSDHSKLKLTTQNVFIESTATDYTKALVVLNIVVSMFSRYCLEPFTVEEVQVEYESDGSKRTTPDFSIQQMETNVHYLSTLTGIKLDTDLVLKYLHKMGVSGKKIDNQKIAVEVPITRSDILHPCDLAEDIAIAYGYNEVPDILPSSNTTGSQLPLNKITDLIRNEVAQAGYSECLNFALCSLDEISKMLNKPEVPSQVVTIANPKTSDFQCARTTLIPGLLKNLSTNKSQKLPIKFFEAGDIVLKADNEIGAKNQRRLAALYTDQNNSGLELIHGLLDYLMIKLNIPRDAKAGYSIQESKDPTFFPGRQAEIFLKGESIGIFGILHPDVLMAFELSTPTSLLEIDLEALIFKGFINDK